MATVKELIDEFCDRINQPRESTIVGSTQPAARQFLSLFKFIGRKLLENPNGWDQLKRIYTFTNSTGVANYQLPGDFHRMLTGTQWGVTNQIALSGPMSNAQLAFNTYGVNLLSPFPGWQVNGAQGYIFATSPYTQRSAGYFQISPAAQDSSSQNVIAYCSNNYVWPQNWVASTAYSLGDMRTGVNNIYRVTTAGTSGATRPSVTSGSVVDGTVTWTVYNEPYPITADTDFSLFDDDLMIEGLRWAWYQAKKQDYIDLKQQWEMTVKSAVGRQNGSMILNAGYNTMANPDWPNTPVGDWAGTGDV